MGFYRASLGCHNLPFLPACLRSIFCPSFSLHFPWVFFFFFPYIFPSFAGKGSSQLPVIDSTKRRKGAKGKQKAKTWRRGNNNYTHNIFSVINMQCVYIGT